MIVGILQIEIFIPMMQSLKEKRMVLKGFKDRLRNNFNIAVSELEGQDKWQRALLAIVSVNRARRDLDTLFSHILNFVEKEREIQIIDYNIELL